MMVTVVRDFWAGGRKRVCKLPMGLFALGALMSLSVAAQPACPPDACAPILATRIAPGPPPALPAPVLSPQGGNQPFGSVIQLSVPDAPVGAETEYSWDGGANWIKGSQVALYATGRLQTRTKLANRVSNQVEATFAPYYRKVFILGNSITQISEAPSIGWFGNWGMAASASDKDYVSLLTTKLKERNAGVEVKTLSGGNFERNYLTFNYEDELDKHIREFGVPDLIIVRVAENVDESQVLTNDFKSNYQTLLNHLTQYSGPVRVVCTTSFFVNQPSTNRLITEVANANGYPVADMATLAGKDQYKPAPGIFTDPGVASHPGDAGMQAIADLIWAKAQ